jgi:hypothetical protein
MYNSSFVFQYSLTRLNIIMSSLQSNPEQQHRQEHEQSEQGKFKYRLV